MRKIGFYCPVCRNKSEKYEVHHIKPKYSGGKDDFDNLIKICKSCHVAITFGFGNKTLNPYWKNIAKERFLVLKKYIRLLKKRGVPACLITIHKKDGNWRHVNVHVGGSNKDENWYYLRREKGISIYGNKKEWREMYFGEGG